MSNRLQIVCFLSLLIISSCNDPSYNDPLSTSEKKEILNKIKTIETDTSTVQWIKNQIQKEKDSLKLRNLNVMLYSYYDQREGKDYFKIKNVIPDEKTASEVAYIYFCNYFGTDIIKEEFPLLVTSIEDYWHVQGSFNHGKGWVGGVAEIAMMKRTGKVIYLIHGK